jgi:DNA-binding NarL/FixJ family response regulator
MGGSVRIIVADHHTVVRAGLSAFLATDPELAVVAEAADACETLELVHQKQPHVLVLDIHMPGMACVDVIGQVKAADPGVRILVLILLKDEPYVFALLRAGADGCLSKQVGCVELVRALKRLAAGQRVLDEDVVVRAMIRGSDGAPAVIPQFTLDDGDCLPEQRGGLLSHRELDVLKLASGGMSNRRIGEALGISDRTVQGHLASVYHKLRVNSRTEAVTKALSVGWLQLAK